MIGRVADAVDDLARFPGMGHAVTDVRIKGVPLREISVRPYRVIYRLRHDRVIILAVIHGSRRLRKALRDRPLE
jgi:plasmid stabilization system protein ParE